MAKYLTSGSILMLALASPAVAAPSPTFEKPRLVLQITVDQFRGDLPTRYFDRLGKGGLRYLLEEGVHYNNAHHAHANTETIVGHVTFCWVRPRRFARFWPSQELSTRCGGLGRGNSFA